MRLERKKWLEITVEERGVRCRPFRPLTSGLSRIAHNTARSLTVILEKAPKEPVIVLNKYNLEVEQGELL